MPKVRPASNVAVRAANNGSSRRASRQSQALAAGPRTFPTWAWPVLLVLVPLILFGRVLSFHFAGFDDGRLVFDNRWYFQIHPESFLHFWRYPFYDEYDPVTYNFFAVLAFLSHSLHFPSEHGLSPDIFHAACLGLHIANSLIVYALLRRLGYQAHACFLGALLFAVQPLQVESIGYIGEMDTPFSTLLCLLALWQYVIYAKADPAGSRKSWMHFGFATLAYAVALVSKPLSVCVPVMALVLELLLFRRPLRQFGWPLAGWCIAALGLGAWTHHIHNIHLVPYVPVWLRPFVAGDCLAFYLERLFIPYPLSFVYARSPLMVEHHWWGYCTWLLPAAVCVAAWKLYRRFPELAAGFGLMVAGTLPMLGFVTFQLQQFASVADRYMYLGMVGPALVLAGLAARLPATRLRTPAVAGIYALLVVFCVLSAVQLSYWRNSVVLYRHCLAVVPGAHGILVILADYYRREGDDVDAAKEYRAAAEFFPGSGGICSNAANAMLLTGDKQGAITYYQRAVADDPSLVIAHFGLGLAYAETGQLDAAALQWETSVQLDPNNPDYRYNLGVAYYRMGLFGDAANQFRAELALTPGDPGAARWLAAAEAAQNGQTTGAK